MMKKQIQKTSQRLNIEASGDSNRNGTENYFLHKIISSITPPSDCLRSRTLYINLVFEDQISTYFLVFLSLTTQAQSHMITANDSEMTVLSVYKQIIHLVKISFISLYVLQLQKNCTGGKETRKNTKNIEQIKLFLPSQTSFPFLNEKETYASHQTRQVQRNANNLGQIPAVAQLFGLAILHSG